MITNEQRLAAGHPDGPDRLDGVSHPSESLAGGQPAETAETADPDASGGGLVAWLQVGRAEWRLAALLVVGLALLGLVVGVLWAELAPRVVYTVIRAGLATENNAESESLFAGDGWFALIGAGAGLVTGTLAWALATSRKVARGPFLVLAVLVASFCCAVVAWRFGVWLGRHPTAAERREDFAHVGHTLRSPLTLRAKGALFFQPFAAVLVGVVWTALDRRRVGNGSD